MMEKTHKETIEALVARTNLVAQRAADKLVNARKRVLELQQETSRLKKEVVDKLEQSA